MSPTTKKRLRVLVNGRAYVVEVGDLKASPVAVTVNGRPYLVEVESGEVQAVAAAGPSLAPEAVARETSVPLKAAAPGVPAGSPVHRVVAPMPGNVIDIRVRPGERVRFRQILCYLEAMKMKSAICSPRDGVIARVQIEDGQTVTHGDVLFSFE